MHVGTVGTNLAIECLFKRFSFFLRFVTKMMDRHGDDFAAMARDPDNIFQLTENKIRRKVTKFINVPEQFEPFARERGLLDDAKKILDGEDECEDTS